jgi:hypothetical protein
MRYAIRFYLFAFLCIATLFGVHYITFYGRMKLHEDFAKHRKETP